MTDLDDLHLPHIEALIEDEGQITLGYLSPVGSVAVASDEHQALAMLRRRTGESLGELLLRLDAAVCDATDHQVFADEINPPSAGG
jgi:hypothetical protein